MARPCHCRRPRLPSVLAAFVTLDASVQNERIHAIVRCALGSKSISIKADPIVDSEAYAGFVSGLRKSVDAKDNACATVTSALGGGASAASAGAVHGGGGS